MSESTSRRATHSLLTGFLITVVAGVLALTGRIPGHWLAHVSFDLPFVLSEGQDITEVVIIEMDEYSLRSWSQDPQGAWDRARHIELLHRLQADEPKAILMDLFFEVPWTNAAVDAQLAAAMKTNRLVVIAAELDTPSLGSQVQSSSLRPPIDQLAQDIPHAVAEMILDSDQVIRRHYSHARYEGIASRVVSLLNPGEGNAGRSSAGWLRYYGANSGIPRVSYAQVLSPRGIPEGYFKDQVVVIGETRRRSTTNLNEDYHRTPYYRWSGEEWPGVYIQATAVLNLLRNDMLYRLPVVLEILLLVLAGAALVLGSGWIRPGLPWACGILILGGVGIGATLVLWHLGWWFSWASIVLVQTPVALAWSLWHHAGQASRAAQSATASDLETKTGGQVGPLQVPDHTLLQPIARGAYGEVWLARNAIGTYHAVKLVMRQHFAGEEPFEREFQGVQKFMPLSRSHPGWVPILHVGRPEDDTCFYYVMELADDETQGQSINPETYQPHTLAGSLQARRSLPLPECLELGLALCEALEFLHDHDLIHRDIKPDNVVYLQQRPRFADIGLVTAIPREDSEVTQVGTLGYMPPEGPGTPAADVYALGKLLYLAATGMETRQYPELPTELAARAHETGFLEFFEILAKACEDNSAYRFQSAREFHEALQGWQPTAN